MSGKFIILKLLIAKKVQDFFFQFYSDLKCVNGFNKGGFKKCFVCDVDGICPNCVTHCHEGHRFGSSTRDDCSCRHQEPEIARNRRNVKEATLHAMPEPEENEAPSLLITVENGY